MKTEDALLQELLEKGKEKYSSENLKKAFIFAENAHKGQMRKSGEPYITHPVEVAKILMDLGMEETVIIAGLLHDVLEDTKVPKEEIEKEFGKDVLSLVEAITKLEKLSFYPTEAYRAQNLRKMFIAMAKDIRVIIIKLADRLHNMQTLQYHDEEKQKRIAKETLEIYAPLAHRLGVWDIKWRLEDLAFRYLEPEKYHYVAKKVAETRKEREKFIEKAIEIIKEELKKTGINAEVTGRAKHLYSIYQKMLRRGIEIEEMYDLLGVRVIVNSEKECYEVLGIIHNLWKPVPGRFKDYIANKKSNNYQSLHTTVIAMDGKPLEVQIRTWEMHRVAEYGIAAHWLYKEEIKKPDYFEEKLSWLRQLLEWQKELADDQEFLESIKSDLFEREIYVFTPKGDIIALPQGSTPIDFAYAIHTEVGHRCRGAKVNGKIVPLNYVLKNGDIVEIITSKEEGKPSRDWLNIVKTTQAKNKIKQYFKKIAREETIEKAKELLENEIKRNEDWLREFLQKTEISLNDLIEHPLGKSFLSESGFKEVESFLLSVGTGDITPQQFIEKFKREYKKELVVPISFEEKREQLVEGVEISGLDNIMMRIAECCHPIPGDKVIGYISKGRGIVIHRIDCPNLVNLKKTHPEKIVPIEWQKIKGGKYKTGIEIEAIDRVGLLKDIIERVAQARINILDLATKVGKDGIARIKLIVEIDNPPAFYYLMEEIKKLSDIISVRRLQEFR
ncbi:RelA/SpoT family protein [Dictyoglomus thermophilum]|uniref:GTP pyrophosphokinase (ATP:GTP 3'-pyrophosphotransferase)(PpGpp synthetase I) ((P)ppGpp synthetase) n=1 Tax=Dictyoglomus thermophilum (strain ATCC 35947 / DSM 3960 / H-6-12) TaxID=309799 RepID=B5YDT3_DICT6|nr:bifunctional (p)ppGpp synthetase/guanosine-3',5'-bis(diphosphate) 3'-pyrophosphohydrolase [Dictyoglomus thermophilum]ACI19252.1 GTP pyrophosphokinase (ATP:GTP 3'-pyrophosphotransferase)(ppGpp synthetase I) ((P)ppGpp synthetase) [Dictyoglomus thermophilum H-6-12]